MDTWAFDLIGANQSLFEFEIEPNKQISFAFKEYGVPESARILAVNYTPQGPGGLFPTQIHPNQLMNNQSMWIANTVHLYPRPMSKEDLAKTKIACLITWINVAHDDPSVASLVEAFAAYAGGKYSEAVIPGNVAVEVRLSRALNTYLEKTVSKKHVESFLNEAATYAHQLNVMLPVLAILNGISEMPTEIRGKLNRLRDLRNDLAHKAALKCPLLKEETAELLAAAIFGTAYVDLFEREIKTPP